MRETSRVALPAKRIHDRQAGMALLVVLWTVALMVLLVISLSNSVQVEVRSATYRKEATQAYAIACGGVQAAIYEIAYPPVGDQTPSPIWSWQKGQRQGVVPFKGGRAVLEIVGDSGKVDLNSASKDQLSRLFEVQGMRSAEAEGLANEIVAWRTPPKSDVQDAADSKNQDTARHAPFGYWEEVLRVPGMSRALFFGTAEVDDQGKVRPRPGVGNVLTVQAHQAQINVNYASELALRSVPGIDSDLARAIIQERKRAPFKTVTEISDRIPLLLPDQSLPYLTTSETSTYSIISTGEVEGSRVRRTVEAVVQLAPENVLRYRIINWYDDHWND
jgi:type II secretory pathway component PulK